MAADLKIALILEARTEKARAEIGLTEEALIALGMSSKTMGAAATEGGQHLDMMGASAGQARTALQQLIDIQTGVTSATGLSAAETLEYGQALDSVRARFVPIFAASQRYHQELLDIAAAEEMGAISAIEAAAARERAADIIAPMTTGVRGLGTAARSTAGSVTQLGFQMNDVIMMASMGQAPLMLMMQQGSQITQVLDDMRARGVKLGPAIGGMLRNLINPWNLLTMAVIAGGAALIQWGIEAFGAGEEAVDLEERIERVSRALQSLQEASRTASQSQAEMTARWGALSANGERAAATLASLARIDALDALDSAMSSLATTFGGLSREANSGLLNGERMTEFAETTIRLGDDLGIAHGQALAITSALEEIGQANGIEAQVAAAEHLDQTLMAVFGSIENVPKQLRDLARQAATLALSASDISGQLAAAEQLSTAEDLLQTQERRNQLLAIEVLFGRDSAQYRTVQRQQELDILDAKLAELDVSEDLKAQIRAAVQEGFALDDAMRAAAAATGSAAGQAGAMAANIRAALGYAQGLAGTIASLGFSNIAQAARIRALEAGATAAEAGVQGQLAEERARLQPLLAHGDPDARGGAQQQLAEYEAGLRLQLSQDEREQALVDALAPTSAGSSAAGGGSAAAETSAVQDLIQSLQDEIAIAREMDPVQQELLRNREALAGASEAERDQVEELIRTRNAEAEALERVQSQMADVRDLGHDMLSGMISDLRDGADGWDILANALGRFADKLIDLGTDSLADVLFGTGQQGGGSGLLGSLLQGILFPSFGGIGMGASGKVASVTKHALGAVYDQPLYFSMSGAGQLGVMAEAGAEAIMPLTHAMGGGVGARLGGEEMTLPLARLASGKLGVDLSQLASPFALGDAFGDIAAVSAPASWRQAGGTASAPATSAPAVGGINIHLDLRGAHVTEDLLPKLKAQMQEAAEAAVKRAVNADNRAFKAATKAVLADRRAR